MLKTAPSKTLSLDPSSSAIGWAVFEGAACTDSGVMKPCPPSKFKWPDQPEFWRRIMSLDASLRVKLMECGKAMGRALCEGDWLQVVIEDGKGKVKGGFGGNGQAVYGQAVGVYCMTLEGHAFCRYERVMPRDWTGGKGKPWRARMAMGIREGYDKSMDTAQLDEADAIVMGDWWIRNGAASK